VSLCAGLGWVILGIGFITLGFFAGHGVASGSLGGLAGQAKGQAASLYMLSYYAGSSLLGTAGGWFWSAGGWPAVTGFVGALLAAALLLALALTFGPLRLASKAAPRNAPPPPDP
jgi:YNFM family putative membrane transporter